MDMRRRITALFILLLLGSALFASYTTLSMQVEAGVDRWYFGDSDKYRTEETVVLAGISSGHYHFKGERLIGWNFRAAGYEPIGGKHCIYDTKKDDYKVEDCDLVKHNLPIGIELAAGISVQKHGFILSVDPTVSLDTWNYGFPTFSFNFGVEVEAALNMPLSDRWNLIAGARFEYDYARYMLGWVSDPISNGFINDYRRVGAVPFIGVSFH